MNKKKAVATVIIGLVILAILVLLWLFVFKDIVANLVPEQQGEVVPPTEQYIPSEKPLTVEEKKEVLDDLLPENLVDTEEEIERREAQLQALQNMGGQSEEDRLNQLNSLGGGVSAEEREKQLQDLAENGTLEQ